MIRLVPLLAAATLAAALATGARAAGEEPAPAGPRDLTVSAAPLLPAEGVRGRSRRFRVALMPLGPSTLAVGTPLRFKMVSTRDGYGHLYARSASGRMQLWFENLRLRAGEPVFFPRQGLTLRAAPPAGDESVMFVVTRKPVAGFADGPTTTPSDLPYTADAFRTAFREKFTAIPRLRWSYASVQIRVRD